MDSPLARNTDPRTSLSGERSANATRKDDKQIMLAFIRYHPSSTANELRQMLVSEQGYSVYRAETLRKRISDLNAIGLVEVSGRRKCRETGKQASTYRAV